VVRRCLVIGDASEGVSNFHGVSSGGRRGLSLFGTRERGWRVGEEEVSAEARRCFEHGGGGAKTLEGLLLSRTSS
jgi:hypothetical protein